MAFLGIKLIDMMIIQGEIRVELITKHGLTEEQSDLIAGDVMHRFITSKLADAGYRAEYEAVLKKNKQQSEESVD